MKAENGRLRDLAVSSAGRAAVVKPPGGAVVAAVRRWAEAAAAAPAGGNDFSARVALALLAVIDERERRVAELEAAAGPARGKPG